MDRFDVERSYVMKKYLSIKGDLITTNIPEKAYITSGTFHHSDTTGLPSSVCVVGCAFIMVVSVYQITKLKLV